jgi:hypothetical protein
MYRQIDHKRDKGYRDVSPAINFTWTAPAASALTPRIIKSSDLALRFEQTWVEQYRPALAALANPTSPRSVVVFTNDPDDVRVWPWLAQLHATLTTLPHFIDAGHRTFAIIPTSTLSALPYNTALARTFAGPALPTDDHVTLEIFAGVWTPDDPTLDTSSPAGALATARLLTPAPL